ncbi:MAG: hypothetical protein L3I99_05135 [Sulfurimonas sp.]|nr:hypothetical protein [Sulfurimonas sp.]
MRRPLKYIGYILFFISVLIYFSPKIAIFYLLENKLNSYSVVISDEKLQDNGLYLNVKDAVISTKGIETAKVKEMKIKIFGLYNSANLTNVKLSPTISSLIPTNVNELHISYSVFNPLNINAYANGGFGNVEVNFNLMNFKLELELEASAVMKKDFKSTLRNLKKLDTGAYSYVKTFKF